MKLLLKSRMRPINQRLIESELMKVGIRANFINFVSRNYQVRVKNRSFKYLRFYFREFAEKLLDERSFDIPIVSEFNARFQIARFQNLHRRAELLECDHSDQCAHTIFDLVSFLVDPEPGLQLGTSGVTPDPQTEKELDEQIQMSPDPDADSSSQKKANHKALSKKSVRGMTDQPVISKKASAEHTNDELRDKIRELSQDLIKPELVFLIPFNVKKYMMYSLVFNIKALKNKYYSNEFILGILTTIKFKQTKLSPLHSTFYEELVEYLHRFFKWNTEYKLFCEHFRIIRDLFDFVSLDLKKMFYDFILKKSVYLFNKRALFLIIYLLNEIRQFRWCFTQIIDQLLCYAAYKGTR